MFKKYIILILGVMRGRSQKTAPDCSIFFFFFFNGFRTNKQLILKLLKSIHGHEFLLTLFYNSNNGKYVFIYIKMEVCIKIAEQIFTLFSLL